MEKRGRIRFLFLLMDDILLNINAIPYLGMERPGDAIYLVEMSDMEEFTTQKLGESEDY